MQEKYYTNSYCKLNESTRTQLLNLADKWRQLTIAQGQKYSMCQKLR